jgi:hypothetical protein
VLMDCRAVARDCAPSVIILHSNRVRDCTGFS